MKDEDFVGGIIKTMFLIRSVMHQEKEGKPISFLRLVVLRYIIENKNITPKDIANYLDITMPSASSIVDDLVKLKLLQRSSNPEDHRSIRLTLTSSGKKIVLAKLREVQKKMRLNLSVLARDEQKNLFQMMQKIYKNLSPTSLKIAES